MNITLNNVPITAENGMTILEVAKANGVNIPTLCHLDIPDIKMVNKVGSCRVCMVEVDGRASLMPACTVRVWEGMSIHTNTKRAIAARRTVTELLLSDHPKDCLVCEKNRECELQDLAAQISIRETKYEGKSIKHPPDKSSRSLIRYPEKCVMCRRCETMCNEVQTVGVYSGINRSMEAIIGTAFDYPVLDTSCTFCGQCVSVCPTGALVLKSDIGKVWSAINDPDKIVVVQAAPAIRTALGEEFGMAEGERVTGKMVAALRRLGFDYVYDTCFAADLTVMEEAHELIERIKNGGTLPMLTSCCPAWVKFIEHQFPDLLDIPSSCKSPHEMFGAVAKTYLAEKLGIDPQKMVVVSIMPCLAKKYEAARSELAEDGLSDVDLVLTTKELAAMLRESGINFKILPDEEFDSVMGETSGAGVIFGKTGGVIEATIRTAAEWITGKPLADVEFKDLHEMDGMREASITIGGNVYKIGIAHGLGNARTLLENIRAGKSKYAAIEIMACPGGCVGGGGQPHHHNDTRVLTKRAKGLLAEDQEKKVRVAHENSEIKALYKDFLGEVGGHKAHELLHTTFTKRKKL